MRFPKTFRRDDTDVKLFPEAAAQDEWAVSGAFVFSDRDAKMVIGRDRQAFRAGFLGTGSFGWSSLVRVAEITPAEHETMIEALTHYLIDQFNAPDHEAARAFAKEEAAFAASLCDRPLGTLITVERSFGPNGIVERFQAVDPAGAESRKLH